MMKQLFFSLVLTFLTLTNASAFEGMRKCMLLPIQEEGNLNLSYKVFDIVEKELKRNTWCTYRSNSEVLEILSDYRKNFKEHLNSKDVLNVIATKINSGSLIRVSLAGLPQSVQARIDVIGQNGKDIYFTENTILNTKNPETVAQQVLNWLEQYERTIPYHGIVKGVLGNQVSIEIGNKTYFGMDSEIEILRMTEKRDHPLLKQIVDYKSEKIAEGKVFDLNDRQAQAKILNYENESTIKANDWVIVKKKNYGFSDRLIEESSTNENELGRNGQVSVLARVGSAQMDQNGSAGKSADALLLGIDVNAEIWATRNFFGDINIAKSFGRYKKDSGTFNQESNTTTNSTVRIFGGYRYLPVGFFYGPQIDLYTGYASYNYGVKTNKLDRLTSFTFSGIMAGVKANFPVQRMVRVYLGFDLILFNDFKEKESAIGKEEDVSSYRIEAGAQLNYAANMSYVFGLEMLKNSADFKGPVQELQFNDVTAKVGAIFTF